MAEDLPCDLAAFLEQGQRVIGRFAEEVLLGMIKDPVAVELLAPRMAQRPPLASTDLPGTAPATAGEEQHADALRQLLLQVCRERDGEAEFLEQDNIGRQG
eukprot:3323195-Alexandrium_andersonii.AAC.1